MSRVILLVILVVTIQLPGTLTGGATQTDEQLAEMPYVAGYATDIFVGLVLDAGSVEDIGRNGPFPSLETTHQVRVDEVIKGNLHAGAEVAVLQPGGVLNRKEEFSHGDGPMAPDERYLFATTWWPEKGVYRIALHLDGSIRLNSDAERVELIARWTTAVKAGRCSAYLDVLRLNGTVYARRVWSSDKRFLEPDWLGEEIATIQRQDFALYGCSPDLTDGDASLLPVGTGVFALKGYDQSFRVAVRLPDKHRWLYEAIWSETARTGADLLDIRDRVAGIDYGRSSFCNEGGCVDYASAGTDDPSRIAEMVEQTLSAPVEPVDGRLAFLEEDETGFINFILDDGSPADIQFNIATGVTTNGIHLPRELVEFVLRGYDTPDGF
jgi:hypothetical protein